MKRYNLKTAVLIAMLLTGTSIHFSCQKFLDAKPSSGTSLLTITDLQGLLDDYYTMNSNYPGDGELSSDGYYQTDAHLTAFGSIDDKRFYVWKADANREEGGGITQWSYPYKVVYNANMVLENLATEQAKSLDPTSVRVLRGSALFFRAYTIFQMAQLYAKPYNPATAAQDLGVPYRTTTAIEDKSDRGTVKSNYDQIIAELTEAVGLLPATVTVKSRPSKAAAYAVLARVYLSMEDYPNAGAMANESLKLQNTLMDFNSSSISKTSATPFTRFNDEVIFHSLYFAGLLFPTRSKIDLTLFNSYEAQDLRKEVLFNANTGSAAGTYRFTGNYEPTTGSQFFNGPATDEMFLIRAECHARANNTTSAMSDLNTLLKKRYINTTLNPFVDKTATSAADALRQILEHRRKELLYRGQRWTDLRRLNKDPNFQVTLKRTLDGVEYTLPPNDLRYVLLIPKQVIDNSNLEQNPR